MAKRTKSEAQLRYKELYGKEPEGSMTVKQLEAAIKEREEEGDVHESEPAPTTSSEPSDARGWTTNPDELVSVENRRSRVRLKGGKETDLTEYYGVKK